MQEKKKWLGLYKDSCCPGANTHAHQVWLLGNPQQHQTYFYYVLRMPLHNVQYGKERSNRIKARAKPNFCPTPRAKALGKHRTVQSSHCSTLDSHAALTVIVAI